jgi:hypothetical protein
MLTCSIWGRGILANVILREYYKKRKMQRKEKQERLRERK